MCAWWMEISEDPPASIGEKTNEIKREVSRGHLGCFEPMKIDVYMPPTRFQVPLPGWRVLMVHLQQWVK
jgi:hypothetical protein